MARVKRSVVARARHKKVLKQAKGYYGARSRVYRVANQAVIKAVNMHTVTVALKNAPSVHYGLCALMQQRICVTCRTVV